MSIETIYNGIQSYIEDNLESYLEDLETDDISVPMFKKIMRSSVYDILGLQIYPALMMEYGRIDVAWETTSQDRYTIPITFYAISKGADAEKLQKKSERYVWALKQMFQESPTVDDLVDMSDVIGYEFSPSLKTTNVFVHTGVIYITFDVLINR